ncbi:MAG: hypothetical protein QOC94_4427 [Actinoplanes sp.]|jgi:hypothetical protein|nr:hypothetical protein [Actinoplanes sp.]MDT5034256.1 hypothetical protein [Actinoplanes sp.]MDT5042232.1 hypothetical protein [Actinoplanes sp.]
MKKAEGLDLAGAQWRASTRSDPGSQHVEVATGLPGGFVAVRDSRDPDGAALIFTPAEWDAFVGGVRDGEFDL